MTFEIPSDLLRNKTLLKDKIILVTGAGAGIGKTAALKFAEYGATVILLGRTQQKLEAVYDEIEANNWPQPFIFPFDLSTKDLSQYQDLKKAVENELPQLDGLLHNGGTLGIQAPIENYPGELWDQVIQTNLNSNFHLTQTLLPALTKSSAGRILFTSSSVGRQGRAFWGAYAVSKFGVEGLMQTLADELENTTSIRVNSVNPGGTRTEMRAAAYPAEDPETVKTAEHLMPLYLFLMSNGSEDIHGQAIDAKIYC